eukprot:scaffold66185_cov40-Cyclotella_meneghiniana.AAC.2
MRFSNFVKFTGPEARGPGKGVPTDAARADASRHRSSISVDLHCRIVSLKRLKWAMAMADGDVAVAMEDAGPGGTGRKAKQVRNKAEQAEQGQTRRNKAEQRWNTLDRGGTKRTYDRGESYSPNSSVNVPFCSLRSTHTVSLVLDSK